MDPDECLRELREAVLEVLLLPDMATVSRAGITPTVNDALRARRADEMAALFKSLDDWLSGGGFAPKAWNPTIYTADPFSGPAIPSEAD